MKNNESKIKNPDELVLEEPVELEEESIQSKTDNDERASQRRVCVQYVQKLHTDFFKSGFKNGSKRVNDFKKRIPILLESDEGGVWTAGQFLKAQLDIENENKICRFKVDTELYQKFIEAVESRAEELKECDEDTYNEDVDVAKYFKDKI